MLHRLALLAAVLAVAGSGGADAEPRKQAEPKAPTTQSVPLHLYVAKGEAGACGPGCSEWIAVEGSFDRDAAARVRAFLNRHGRRGLPLYFYSPGGNQSAALAIGRELRKRGLTAGVAMTIPRGCERGLEQSAGCRAAKRSGNAVAAAWQPVASCNSACVFAVLGGKERHVPPGARLGIHAGKLFQVRRFADGREERSSPKELSDRQKAKTAEFAEAVRYYIRQMGIDDALFQMSIKVPHESIRYLSRDEIAAFGIDARTFDETRWLVFETRQKSILVSKWIVEARGPGKDYRVSVISLLCSSAERARILYLRGLASDEIGWPRRATFVMGNYKAQFSSSGRGARRDSIDHGAQFSASVSSAPFAALESAVASGAIHVLENDPTGVKQARVAEFSTAGLADGVKMLRDTCLLPSAMQSPAADVPFLPAQSDPQSPPIPGMPAVTPAPAKTKK